MKITMLAIAGLYSVTSYADSITFQQWRFTNSPANFNNIPADFPNPNNAFSSAPGATHGDSVSGRTGVLLSSSDDITFTIPNTVVNGRKDVDVTLIYRLVSGGMLDNTQLNMPGFTGIFPPGFNAPLPGGWFQASVQFVRTTGCPANETLTVKNPGNLAIDYAAVRTECAASAVPEPSSYSLAVIAIGLLAVVSGVHVRRAGATG